MSPEPGATSSAPDPRLDDRIMELLTARAGRIAFNGLRRSLGAHPESLARALRRLERDGLVNHADDGYWLNADGIPPHRPQGPASDPLRAVASVTLPPGIEASEVLGALAGRWFGRLRWLGIYEGPGEPRLVWSVGEEARGHVLLAVRRGTLRVYVDRPRNAVGSGELEEAAHDLLVRGLTRLRRADHGAGPSTVLFADAARRFGSVEN